MFKKFTLLLLMGFSLPLVAEQLTLLNSSYDIAREIFQEYNQLFLSSYKKSHPHIEVNIEQSHAGSSKQVNSILHGLQADVVTLNQVLDIQTLAQKGFVDKLWQEEFPYQASPYYSLPVFLVRKGNKKNLQDWPDLAKKGVKILFPNPRTSGNGRYSYLTAWLWSEKQGYGESEKMEFMRRFLGNVLLFDTGGRGASNSFTERRLGDVLLTFEAEALRLLAKRAGKYEIVYPSLSLIADFPIALIKKNSREDADLALQVSQDYLNFLYAEESQRLLAQFYYRVHQEDIMQELSSQFASLSLLEVEKELGPWQELQNIHFAEGGYFDSLSRR